MNVVDFQKMQAIGIKIYQDRKTKFIRLSLCLSMGVLLALLLIFGVSSFLFALLLSIPIANLLLFQITYKTPICKKDFVMMKLNLIRNRIISLDTDAYNENLIKGLLVDFSYEEKEAIINMIVKDVLHISDDTIMERLNNKEHFKCILENKACGNVTDIERLNSFFTSRQGYIIDYIIKENANIEIQDEIFKRRFDYILYLINYKT